MHKGVLSAKQVAALNKGFQEQFGILPEKFFSAPGRTEIGGNHTDHQHGKVLAAAVNLDSLAAVRKNGTQTIRVLSRGYPMVEIQLGDLSVRAEEVNTTAALIRGIAARFAEMGHPVGGFDAYIESTVLPGSGLSSSAAFEVLIGTVINHLFCNGTVSQPQIAMIGQFAENTYFGKPCGLMDQMASAVGGLVYMDFENPAQPRIEPVCFDFSACGHALCIIDSGANHADLTEEYAAIPKELQSICSHFGKKVLRQVDPADFCAALPVLRKKYTDRAVLRAIHIYEENERVSRQAAALQAGAFDTFLSLVRQSGYSSYMYLQNVIPAGSIARQDMAVALALCAHYLQGRGAYRVHGGGFAGTVQAFVPLDLLDSFRAGMDGMLGAGACHVLSIRPLGGVEAIVG